MRNYFIFKNDPSLTSNRQPIPKWKPVLPRELADQVLRTSHCIFGHWDHSKRNNL